MKQYIAYYRVSTQKQGVSGLGLAAQHLAVRQVARDESAIIAEYTEVESGKHDARQQLRAAIDHAKTINATLIIAKLDRLSRNAGFIFALRDSGAQFVCADVPEANTLTIGIFAVMAQHERELISERTKAALRAKKAQGYSLGTNNLTNEGRRKGILTRQARSQRRLGQATEVAQLLRDKGLSLRGIAERLNAKGYATSLGKAFQATSVMRLLAEGSEVEATP